ncbi:SPOR domain-containing protein [Luteimonas sp. JM171]|uniref:SPOR domain-containing protein n=1 Tax=Luteimonas sp. JM171 TaxID=1896164 RepID=UPI0008557C69|nr:SPOR domain-containing protein [Luteimonas sp. JM171]AOH35041.1 hypothetical protein BGP89_00565 [Luteimonas sp. JM171]
MDPRLKQRLIGAAVLVALAVIFLPMLVKGPAPDSGVSDLSLDLPERPRDSGTVTRDLPLVAPRPRPDDGALGLGARQRGAAGTEDGALPTVDTADARHPDAAQLADEVAAGTGEPAGPQEPGERADADDAEAEVAADAALPATTAGGDYAVRFGSYGKGESADVVVERLEREGFPASSTRAQVAGRDVWRVHIGPYASRAEAEAVRVRAAQVGPNNAEVVALDAQPPRPRPEPSERTAEAPAPAQPEPAATAPAAAPDVGFVVQLGAFSNAGEATAMRDRLRGMGFTAFTDTVQTDRGLLTRVKAGPVLERAEAEQLKARIQGRTGIDGMVRSHP